MAKGFFIEKTRYKNVIEEVENSPEHVLFSFYLLTLVVILILKVLLLLSFLASHSTHYRKNVNGKMEMKKWENHSFIWERELWGGGVVLRLLEDGLVEVLLLGLSMYDLRGDLICGQRACRRKTCVCVDSAYSQARSRH